MAGGRLAGTPSARRRSLSQQAMGVLIAADWAIGEASAQRLDLSAAEVVRQLSSKKQLAFPGGAEEIHEFERATGQTAADLDLEARAELAGAKLREAAVREQAAVTPAQIAAYYSRHQTLFAVPERRDLLITNRKAPANVYAIRRQVESGRRSFDTVGERGAVERPREARRPGEVETGLERAIYAARPRVLIGPIRNKRIDYFVFEVVHIRPAYTRPLAQVRGVIERRLASERRRRAIVAFVNAWRRRWTARTICSPGYVVEGCREYAGAQHASSLSLP
jgi:parvulin-like peptidyl-prolyl cis-trans isomerase-like protein